MTYSSTIEGLSIVPRFLIQFELDNSCCTDLLLNLVKANRDGTISLGAAPNSHLDSQKGGGAPIPNNYVCGAKKQDYPQDHDISGASSMVSPFHLNYARAILV
jgi:hypothetical protein